MRFLNKFYSFIKSTYLNDSKYSNNLRHTFRIFFEREVKTKNTPTSFGSLFKGSKWTDYKTFNINKLITRSSTMYFFFLISILIVFCFYLGRSKSEQYFGYLPLFSYVNFILGYIPLTLHEGWSQVLIYIYITHLFFTNLLLLFVNTITTKYLNLWSTSYSKLTYPSKKQNSTSIQNKVNNLTIYNWLGQLYTTNNVYLNVLNFSKTLSNLELNLNNLNTLPVVTSYSIGTNTKLFSIGKNIKYPTKRLILDTETYYVNSVDSLKNTKTTLSAINSTTKKNKSLQPLNFNIISNLGNAKEQRWLVRNSLLSNGILTNSSLITQSKKIIGLGLYNKDLTTNSLWFPTKTSKTNPLETTNQLNSIVNNTQNDFSTINYLFHKNYNLHKSTITTLNFFENSRLWLTKKYYFSNQQVSNIVMSVKNLDTSHPSLNKQGGLNNYINFYTPTFLTSKIFKLFLKPNMSPSLINYDNKSPNSVINTTTQLNVNLNTGVLDTFSNSNTNIVFLITSNPKGDSTNWNYFSNNYNMDYTSNTNTPYFTFVN